MRFALQLPDSLTIQGSAGQLSVAISPDGRELVVPTFGEAGVRYFRRPLASLQLLPFASPVGLANPEYSPDAQWIAYEDAAGDLVKMPTSGGPAVRIAQDAHRASWGDHDSLLFVRAGNFWTISANGGDARQRTQLDTRGGVRGSYSSYLPGARAALVNIAHGDELTPDEYDVALLDLDNGDVRSLGLSGSNPRYLPTGHILFARQGGMVLAVPFDLASRKVTGTPKLVLDSVEVRNGGVALFGVSGNGTLAYIAGRQNRSIATIDRAGRIDRLNVSADIVGTVRLSPDGARLAYETLVGVDSDVWVLDLRTLQRTKISNGGVNTFPEWNANSEELIYQKYNARQPLLVRKRFTGTAAVSTIPICSTTAVGNNPQFAVAPNGRFVIVTCNDTGKRTHSIVSLDSAGASKEIALGGDVTAVSISPDSRWVAYVRISGSKRDIFVANIDNPSVRLQISDAGGTGPGWTPDGKSVIYSNGAIVSATLTFAPRFEVVRRDTILDLPNLRSSGDVRTFDRDSRTGTFVAVVSSQRTVQQQLIVVTNWFDELRARFSADGAQKH